MPFPSRDERATPPPHAVCLRDVHKSFSEGSRKRAVLAGIDLAITSGERVALLGRSGSGKSTLLNLIAGLETPSAGEIEVAGASLGKLSEAERTRLRRDQIGFVFQSYNLIPTLTVLENILLPLELAGRDDASGRAEAEASLDKLGLADRARAFPDVLSGGEQQRVAIARALAHRPTLLLADEPTGNLDDGMARDVLALLDEALRAAQATLIIATHSARAASIATRVLRVEAGRLVASTAKDTVPERP